MIISASRRTDIPAFYAEWFMERIRAGFCIVANPFNADQEVRVDLSPQSVDVIVFWTRNPRPLMKYLEEITHRGYQFYFQFTLMNNPRELDPKTPALKASLATFQDLAAQIGAEKVVWRYDPIVFSNVTGTEFHLKTFEYIAGELRGCTHRSIISIMDEYPKIQPRLKSLAISGFSTFTRENIVQALPDLLPAIVEVSHRNGMQVYSCAEDLDLVPYGVKHGKCVDDDYIREVFGLQVNPQKDPNQRRACGCVVSKDIGAYDTCLFGCAYCYATQSFERAQRRHDRHDPFSEKMI